jgi:NAD-dependent deacetylase
MVLHFYNLRRKAVGEAKPNQAHYLLAGLEEDFEVIIITQNIDNLHECAGSTQVLHLHGEIFRSRSTVDPSLRYDIDGWELNLGHTCERGSQLRPDIVWFGEAVPMMEPATIIASEADFFAVVGTSLVVYPAASLLQFAPSTIHKYIVDPIIPETGYIQNLHTYPEIASAGVQMMKEDLYSRLA